MCQHFIEFPSDIPVPLGSVWLISGKWLQEVLDSSRICLSMVRKESVFTPSFFLNFGIRSLSSQCDAFLMFWTEDYELCLFLALVQHPNTHLNNEVCRTNIHSTSSHIPFYIVLRVLIWCADKTDFEAVVPIKAHYTQYLRGEYSGNNILFSHKKNGFRTFSMPMKDTVIS